MIEKRAKTNQYFERRTAWKGRHLPASELSVRDRVTALLEETARLDERRAFLPVVAVGVAEGGGNALELFLKHLPGPVGLAFVVVQKQESEPTKSVARKIEKFTPLAVKVLEDGMPVWPDIVYVAPGGARVSLFHGAFYFSLPDSCASTRDKPIDFCFRSLAVTQADRAIGIVMAGQGTEGAIGIEAIETAGGLALVQSTRSDIVENRPQKIITAVTAGKELPADEIPRAITNWLDRSRYVDAGKTTGCSSHVVANLPVILDFLQSHRNYSFYFYKTRIIARRIERCMMLAGVSNIQEYLRYLKCKPREIDFLIDQMLIDVTHFFRNPTAFEVLREKVIVPLMNSESANEGLRVWVPGCSTGEEACSLAILFREEMERSQRYIDVKIFATDINSRSIDRARSGVYRSSVKGEIDERRSKRFFVEADDGLRIDDSIRKMIVYGHHDVLRNPPFKGIDLISCRNLLIYLKDRAQLEVVDRFCVALNREGFLFLGCTETIGYDSTKLATVDSQSKIFHRRDCSRSWQAQLRPFRSRISISDRQLREARIRDLENQIKNMRSDTRDMYVVNQELRSMNEELEVTKIELERRINDLEENNGLESLEDSQ